MAAEVSSSSIPSRSPSPASRPPVASTPGPRATALQKLYSDAIAHVLKTCNYTNFSSCFPTPAQHVPGSLKMLHEQFTDKLGESMRKEFDAILDDRHVVSSLNELDGLIEEARKRKGKSKESDVAPTPPHTLPAHHLYLSHLAPSLQQYSASIKERQDAVQTENVELLGRVMQQRKDIESLVKGLENVVSDLDASVASMQAEESNVEGLRDEVRGLDEDMRMTT
ncbi:hypothetical protein LTR37_014752 [Vermiconidia calcicola]|uniref:Uncharacterized protein n=1 Tax=Vermiconidia calcicola TaxID=1690605 RepID=A0ACC3MVD1_9PEZI|nr:hypothetical protein LTR37_014752 [Vermiconidia calcicola]